jgi:NADH dehydrogenase
VGSELISFQNYVKLFSRKTQTRIKKISLESAYHDAISKPRSEFGVDDLNLLIGDFKGDHKKLKNISKISFQSIKELLESRSLL